MHWTLGYLGTPWVAGESDCWAFARRVWRERYGLAVPDVAVDAASPLDGRRAFRDQVHPEWSRTEAPCEGDAVLMAMGGPPCHVGVFVAPGAVLHSIEKSGVIVTHIPDLGRIGYRVAGFYRWQDA